VRTIATQVFLVAFGSSIGGVARWAVGIWFADWFGRAFPWGTLSINVSGSMFLGWFFTVLDQRLLVSGSSWINTDDLKLLVAIGFTGAYTTFSTFEYETHDLLSRQLRLAAAAYIALSVFLGLLAVQLGVMLAGRR
jgi:fluoride exporter